MNLSHEKPGTSGRALVRGAYSPFHGLSMWIVLVLPFDRIKVGEMSIRLNKDDERRNDGVQGRTVTEVSVPWAFSGKDGDGKMSQSSGRQVGQGLGSRAHGEIWPKNIYIFEVSPRIQFGSPPIRGVLFCMTGSLHSHLSGLRLLLLFKVHVPAHRFFFCRGNNKAQFLRISKNVSDLKTKLVIK